MVFVLGSVFRLTFYDTLIHLMFTHEKKYQLLLGYWSQWYVYL